MAAGITVSLDVMGGDHGAPVVLGGADLAAARFPGIRYVLFGRADAIEPLLQGYPRVREISTVRHADVAVTMDEKPSQALRRGRWRSSMWLAIEAVKKGEADVAVSAGNTGALMAMAHFCLKTMADIERPAIAGVWPTLRGSSVVLDIGATIGAKAPQLVDCAVMGAAMARALFGIPRPTVGLLNIGVEEVKGLEEVRAAGRLLKEANLASIEYAGFVEGDDLGKGTVDVVVTEGFSGNIALKTAEGTARQIVSYLRQAMGRNLRSRIGYLLAKPAFESLREKIDPRKANGGVFLGLNGIVVKSHGGTDAEGFASAIGAGHSMVRDGVMAKIHEDLTQYHRQAAVGPQPAVVSEAR
ncbi:MAG: phosphate acyltransferase PlsX [Bauldia sp.]